MNANAGAPWLYVPDGRDPASLAVTTAPVPGSDPLNTTAVLNVSRLGTWAVGLIATDGCYNVSVSVTATAACAPAAPLPVLSVAGSNGPANFSLLAAGDDPAAPAAAYTRVLTLWFGARVSASPGPLLRSADNVSVWNFSDWTLLSHTCPPNVIGNPAGPALLPLPPVTDATNAITAGGGQCRFDADPVSLPALLAPIGTSNVTWTFAGVGTYTLQYRVYDGCNVVPVQQVVQVRVHYVMGRGKAGDSRSRGTRTLCDAVDNK